MVCFTFCMVQSLGGCSLRFGFLMSIVISCGGVVVLVELLQFGIASLTVGHH